MERTIAKIMTTALFCSLLTGCSSEDATVSQTAETADSAVSVSTLSTSGTGLFVVEDQFSSSDYEVGSIADTTSQITLSDNQSTTDDDSVLISGNTITITQAGSYQISGSLTNGQIIVDAGSEEKIQLLLDGVSISNDNTAPIYVKQADKVFITLCDDTVNTLSATLIEDETAESNVDAVIFSKEDLTINGEGALIITAIDGNGITSKDDLVVTGGELTITADKHGLEANNSIRVANGTFVLTTQKDGLHSEHDEDTSLGYIFIQNGDFTIDAQGDGLDASGQIEILNGDFDIITAGGSANAPEQVAADSGMGGGMMPGGMGGQSRTPSMASTDTASAEMQDANVNPAMQGSMGGQQMGTTMPTDITQNAAEGADAVDMQEMPSRDTASIPEMQDSSSQPAMQGGVSGQTMGGEAQMGDNSVDGESTVTSDAPAMQNDRQSQITGGNAEAQNVFTSGEPLSETSIEDDSVSAKGIKANSTLLIHGGNFTIDAYDDAIHSNASLEILGGNFTIATGDDAVNADFTTLISGGYIDISTCYEGIEGQYVGISGGEIYIVTLDDGINASRADTASAEDEVCISISGGLIVIDAYDEGDGIDSNENIEMSGGTVIISGTTDIRNTTLDYSGSSWISGGTFLAAGSNSQTTQNFGDASTQGSILVALDDMQEGEITLANSDGEIIAQFVPVKEYQCIIISTAEIVIGETYTLTAGDYSETIAMDTLIYGEGNEHSNMQSMGNRMGR